MKTILFIKFLFKNISKVIPDTINDVNRHAKDGFMYIAKTQAWGVERFDVYYNEATVQEHCDEYYGDNGFVFVQTNNPNHSVDSYSGSVIIVQFDASPILRPDQQWIEQKQDDTSEEDWEEFTKSFKSFNPF